MVEINVKVGDKFKVTTTEVVGRTLTSTGEYEYEEKKTELYYSVYKIELNEQDTILYLSGHVVEDESPLLRLKIPKVQ